MTAYAVGNPWQEVGSIRFQPANPPTGIAATGCFPEAVAAGSIVRNGAGDYSFTLSEAIDSTQFDFKCQMQGAVAASGLQSAGVAHTSDTEKRFTMLQEAALGATSALTDYASPVVIRVFKKVVRT